MSSFDNELLELNQLADDLTDHQSRFRVARWTAPTNRAAEEEKFLAAFNSGESYSPIFEYEPVDQSAIEQTKQMLESVHPKSTWHARVRDGLRKSLASLSSYSSRNPDEISAASIDSYGTVEPAALDDAAKILTREVAPDTSASQTPREAKARLARALTESGLDRGRFG